ncbi:hypothetical protein [Pseudomonas sp.]|uniref:hypothetical protein n=1 Tax=Pseudomonas sp. TaxID=306 RepID=UPI0028A129F1|nr:hypothetical protein [Pseudomonas sp.]
MIVGNKTLPANVHRARRGPKVKSGLGHRELVLAYELKAEGCSWKNIARGLGCDADKLRWLIAHYERYGLTA